MHYLLNAHGQHGIIQQYPYTPIFNHSFLHSTDLSTNMQNKDEAKLKLLQDDRFVLLNFKPQRRRVLL